ncbi:MAG: hypothetical protein DPW09_03335 [Anaerolineae bacterium]|nr:hypothetical protein [Anaerolineales bacterium]MCQ3972464.1 hypothetical protein [Anaerolineae bacterium]
MINPRTTTYQSLTLTQKIALSGGVILTLAVLGILAAPHMPRMRDFDQTFYPAIRYALAGQNPYTSAYQMTDQGTPPVFYSPPWFLVVLLPFGLLPFEIARAEWMIFLIVVTCLGLASMGWWGFKGAWFLALATLPWSLIGILYGQPTALVFLGAILAITQVATTQTSVWSALFILLGIILMGIKPQLGLFIVLPLGLWLGWRRDPRLGWVVGGGIAFLILVWLIAPAWLLTTAANTGALPAPLWQSTLERELLLWQLPQWTAGLVRVGVIAVMILWVWRAKDLTPAWWSAMLAAVLIITPYTRAYDGVLLLPILGQIVARRRLAFLIFLIVVIAYTSLPLGELGSVVTPLTAWLLFVPWPDLISFFRRSVTPR